MFDIVQVWENREDYLPLLLLADEQKDMIDRYINTGDLYALYDGGLKTVAIVTEEDGCCELRNIATDPRFQGRGYGRAMVSYLCQRYSGHYRQMLVGTGDSPLTVPFYQSCGFVLFRRVANYFTEHYDHPIYEDGKLLTDLVYLKKDLKDQLKKVNSKMATQQNISESKNCS